MSSERHRDAECAGASPQFLRVSQLLNNEHGAEPREEPYLEPTYLNKPILDTYDPVGVDRLQIEDPDSSWAWIRADPEDFIDAEGYR